jgi:hypothetical protein
MHSSFVIVREGATETAPPDVKLVFVLPNGDLGCRTDDPKVLARFYRWRDKSCRHKQGMAAGDSLVTSNSSLICAEEAV